MTYEGFRYLFIIAAIVAAVMLIVTVLLFFLFKIPSVIGDLSGATARKAIKEIREQNEKTGDKGYSPSAYNVQRGKVTDKISGSGRINRNASSGFGGINTSKISTQSLIEQAQASETTVLENTQGDSTTVLNPQSNETTVLNQQSNETTVLNQQSNETTVLSPQSNETTVLSPQDTSVETVQLSQCQVSDKPDNSPAVTQDTLFAIEYDITFINTNEFIG